MESIRNDFTKLIRKDFAELSLKYSKELIRKDFIFFLLPFHKRICFFDGILGV